MMPNPTLAGVRGQTRQPARLRRTDNRRRLLNFFRRVDRHRDTPRSVVSTNLGSTHDLHSRRLDFKSDPDLAGFAIRVFVLAQIFLGEGVDMRGCALLSDMSYPSADLDVPISIVGVEDGKRHRSTLCHVARLHTTFRRVHP